MPSTVSFANPNLPRRLGAWVAQLMARYPDFDEHDLAGMIEEKTGTPVTRRDFETVRSHFLRAKLRAWSPEAAEADR